MPAQMFTGKDTGISSVKAALINREQRALIWPL